MNASDINPLEFCTPVVSAVDHPMVRHGSPSCCFAGCGVFANAEHAAAIVHILEDL